MAGRKRGAVRVRGSLVVGTTAGQLYLVKARIWATRTDTAGTAAAWELGFSSLAGNLVSGTPSPTAYNTAPSGWSVQGAAAFGLVGVEVTGATGQTITWHAEVDVFGPLAS